MLVGSCWLVGCCGGSVVIVGFVGGGAVEILSWIRRGTVLRVERTKRGRDAIHK